MRNKFNNNPATSQLRRVVLLLAIAVILPTVCLLWFMTQAVKNERLAIRQKLADVYQGNLSEALKKSGTAWEEDLGNLRDKLADSGPLDIFDSLTGSKYAGAVVYDESGSRIYPVLTTDINSPSQPAEIFEDAWRLEFSGRYLAAAQAYEQKADPNDDYVRSAAIIAKSRCLAKLGKLNKAIETCKKAAFSPAQKQCDVATLTLISNARLFLMGLLNKSEQSDNGLLYDTLIKVLDMLHEENEVGSFLPSDQRIFLLHRTIDIYNNSPHRNNLPRELYEEDLRRRIAAEELSIRSIGHFPTADSFEQWHWLEATFRRIERPQPAYGIYYTIGSRQVLGLMTLEKMAQFWQKTADDMDDEMVFCRVLDDKGKIIAGQPEVWVGERMSFGQRFLTRSPGEFFPDWKVELYFRYGIFSAAANQQRTIYLWTAFLVIGLMILVSGLAAKAILRQARLSKLKNDFIATITHELKTPLASMRVLADTLLDGNYKDERTAREYLELICRENKRLTGLIDNFLTFSRMERNKQAFEMEPASPAEIARSAAEAVKTKFSKGRCDLALDIADDLPDVLADRDAMVTVLVNLLDNAYKYSRDDKRIELKAYADDGSVCFAVRDNGIGISRRVAKKIFKRFYQADRTLSRRAEGTGLGLSIARFIVDAHNGTISVDSKPEQGSTFMVRLPAVG